MENKIIHVWISRYALTQGLFEIDARVCSSPDMIEKVDISGFPTYFHGKEWHRTKEDAIKRAESMKLAKIKNLKKQLEQLEQLKFD